MKTFTNLLLVAGLFSISQLAYPDSITDTYNTGDTLTATTLDNIKSAVNDNDTRINTNETNISNKVDKAGDTMTGALSAPDFTYDSPQTRYYSIGLADVVLSDTGLDFFRNESQLEPLDASTSFVFYAPIHLPGGATITAVDVYTTDSANTARIEWKLEERTLNNGALNITIASNSGDDAAIPGLENLNVTGLVHVVNNSQNYYRLRLFISNGNPALNLFYHSARITYTVNKPD